MSLARAFEEKLRRCSLEPPAGAPSTVSDPVPPPSSASAWPSMGISRDPSKSQSKPKTPGADTEASAAGKRVILSSKSSQSQRAMSYAEMARKNLPAKKAAQPPPVAEKAKAEHVDSLDSTASAKQAKEVDVSASARPTANPESVDTSAPAQPTQRATSTPELLLAINAMVRSSEPTTTAQASLKSAMTKPGKAMAGQSQEKVSETPSATAQDTAETKEPSPKKNRPLTWAGVVRGQKPGQQGQKATVLPTSSSKKPPTPHLQPATPQLRPATPNSTTSPKKHKKTQSQAKSTGNRRPNTPGRQVTGGTPGSPASIQSQTAKHEHETPGQKLGKQNKRRQPTDSEGKGEAAASPPTRPDSSSSDVERASAYDRHTNRRVPLLHGHLAATLRRQQDQELAQQQQQQELVQTLQTRPVSSNPPHPGPLRPSLGPQVSHWQQTREQVPAHQYGANFGPHSGFPPLNTSWPALPSHQARPRMDNIPDLSPSSFTHQARIDNTRSINQPGFDPQARVGNIPNVNPLRFNYQARMDTVPSPNRLRSSPQARLDNIPNLNRPGFDGNTDHGHGHGRGRSPRPRSPLRQVVFAPASHVQHSPVQQVTHPAVRPYLSDAQIQSDREREFRHPGIFQTNAE